MLQIENPELNQLKQSEDMKRKWLKGFILQMIGN